MPRTTLDTALGTCALAWGDAGLTRFELPAAPRQPTDVARPPAEIEILIARVQRHLARFDFTTVTDFQRRVYEAALHVKAARPGATAKSQRYSTCHRAARDPSARRSAVTPGHCLCLAIASSGQMAR